MLNSVLFYFQSILSGLIEFGIIYFGYTYGINPSGLILIGVSYQLGNLLRNYKIKKLSLIMNLFTLFILIFAKSILIKLLLLSLSISVNLQLVRDVFKAESNTLLKRSCRIIGFALIPTLNYKIIIVVWIVSLIIYLYKFDQIAFNNQGIIKITLLDKVMLFHQLHYFSYCYIIFYLIISMNIKSYLTIVIFVMGWVSYTITQKLLKNTKSIKYAQIAHLLLSITLFILSVLVDNIVLMPILWIITGFFGGTVYILKYYLLQLHDMENTRINYIEDIGHFFGALLSYFIILIFNNYSLPIILAGIFAILTVISIRRSLLDE